MKNLTNAQTQTLKKLEHLLGVKIEAQPLRKHVFLVNLPAQQKSGFCELEAQIYRVAHQYKLGRIEPSGVNQIAFISQT